MGRSNSVRHFAYARVNLHKRAGTKQRVESHVLKANVTVKAMTNVEGWISAMGTSPHTSTRRERRLVLSTSKERSKRMGKETVCCWSYTSRLVRWVSGRGAANWFRLRC